MALFLTTTYNDPMLTDVERTLDQVLDRALGRWTQAPRHQSQQPTSAPTSERAVVSERMPDAFRTLASVGHHAFDVIESKDGYELVADAPGFHPSDITVELAKGVLTISGTRLSQQAKGAADKEEEGEGSREEGEGSRVWRRERSVTTSFRRMFTLPANAHEEGIVAKLDKGVLTVHVPKRPELPKQQPRKITVQESAQ